MRGGRAGEIRVIEAVEHLPANLKPFAFVEAEILEHLGIEILQARTDENIATGSGRTCPKPEP